MIAYNKNQGSLVKIEKFCNVQERSRDIKNALGYFNIDLTSTDVLNQLKKIYKTKALMCHPDVYHHRKESCKSDNQPKECLKHLDTICGDKEKELYTTHKYKQVLLESCQYIEEIYNRPQSEADSYKFGMFVTKFDVPTNLWECIEFFQADI
jgi:hypothetical protein